MGNSIYGNVCQGISNKRKFDVKVGKNLPIEPSSLSNPILASYTTAFIRSVVGECLDNINKLGGKIVSVTTDGFITDLPDLENKLLNCKNNYLFKEYRKIRFELSKNPEGIELKQAGVGIIYWTTRGQIGIESNIKAITGFQSRNLGKDELVELFSENLKSEEKTFEFIQSSLRSARDIYLHVGHLTNINRDQTYRQFFDNRRLIVEPENLDSYDLSEVFLDSRPVSRAIVSKNLRFLSSFHLTSNYNKLTSKTYPKRYKK